MSAIRKDYIRPIDFKRGLVDMSHGSGGRAMAQLIDELFLAAFDNVWLREMNDQAREISDEIWIRGEHGEYDRAHIVEEWTARHAADWRHWRLTEYLYVMERLAGDVIARLRPGG